MSTGVVIVGVAALAGILLLGGAGKGDGGGFGGGAGGGDGDSVASKFSDVADIVFNLPSYVVPDEPFEAKKIPTEIDFSGYLSTHEASQLPGFPDTMGSLNIYFDTIRGQPNKKQAVSDKWSFSEYMKSHNIFGKEIDRTQSTSLFKPAGERTGFGKWFGQTALLRYGEHQSVNRQVAEYTPKKSIGGRTSPHGLSGYFSKGIGASDGSLGIPARIKLRQV